MTQTKIEVIRKFLVDEIIDADQKVTIDATTSLIQGGIVPSISVMHIIFFLEERFGVVLPDEDFAMKNFETLERIAALADRCQPKV